MSDGGNSEPNVVITGIGVVSPIGIGVSAFRENLLNGRSGIAQIEQFDGSLLPGHIGGEVKDFSTSMLKELLERKQRKNIRVMCREIQLGVASASLAFREAGIDREQLDPERLGLEFGANLMLSPPWILKDGCFEASDIEAREFHYDEWGTAGMSKMEPLWLLKYLPNMPACHIGIFHDARGPNNSQTMDEASGNLVLSEATHIISRGAADVMLAGATGTRIHPVKSMHAVMWDHLAEAEDPATACRPFGLNRIGEVVAEGACTFVLESEEHASRRGAKILGRILGTGAACVVDREGNADISRALVVVMQKALAKAGVGPEDIGHINAHGLATKESDVLESGAIREVFGEDVMVTGLKSYFGNSGASCGILEVAGSLVGLQEGVVPATLNYNTPDPECPLNVVAGEAAAAKNQVFLNINVTRLGQASAVVVRAS